MHIKGTTSLVVTGHWLMNMLVLAAIVHCGYIARGSGCNAPWRVVLTIHNNKRHPPFAFALFASNSNSLGSSRGTICRLHILQPKLRDHFSSQITLEQLRRMCTFELSLSVATDPGKTASSIQLFAVLPQPGICSP